MDDKKERRKATSRKASLKWYAKNKPRALAANREWCAKNLSRRRETRRAWVAAHPGCTLVWAAKNRATKAGLPFDLTYEATKFPARCPVFGIQLDYDYTHGRSKRVTRATSASLDRIDNSRGYTLDNVVVMSYLANTMKQNATPDQLRLFAHWIESRFGEP